MEKNLFVKKIKSDLAAKVKHSKRSVEKLAATFGITDKTLVKELSELAIVLSARQIARLPESIKGRYDKIVDLYRSQVNLSHRTSQSILLQQYSTPAPIAFLAGIYILSFSPPRGDVPVKNRDRGVFFEPSAGNGLLTIALDSQTVIVNEIDPVRRANLQEQNYKQVLKQDATEPFTGFVKKFDGVLTNPPFGTLDSRVMYDGYPIRVLDHLMALRALDTMKDSGRAAIIIGGHTAWDEKGRIQAGKNLIFFNFLYSHYIVDDVININGSLYSRQGTSFDVRLILIDGRKQQVKGAAPARDPKTDRVVTTFDELFYRVMQSVDSRQFAVGSKIKNSTTMDISKTINVEIEIQALELEKQLHGIYNMMNNRREQIKRMDEFRSGHLHYIHFLQGEKHWYRVDDEFLFTSTVITEQEYNEAKEKNLSLGSLEAPYNPASEGCVVLNTQVPDSMEFEIHSALERIKQEVGGDMDEFVMEKSGYRTRAELCKSLSAEQIDAVGIGIYNIEEKGQGMIIGDQTGIGKGRVAAAMIRYAVHQGLTPVFLTEKANLFSDLYRDLAAIGSKNLVPFIINSRESKTDIKDESGEIIYQAPSMNEQKQVFKQGNLNGKKYEFVMSTYSQFNSPDKKPEKPSFLKSIANGNILILDESHNASGSSNTGEFLQSVIAAAKGVIFLSATFAKRADNMPIYAMKTAMSDANMTKDELVEAITKGGVALQEVLSSQLVKEGQMIRRERSFEGVEVNYITLEENEQEHRAVADNITEILREIISFQISHVDKQVEELDKIAVAEGKQVNIREGTSQAGVDNQPYFSKVFNVINQMLFSIKASAVAERAIQRLKEGKKPVIAFSSTMGSFIEQMEDDKGLPVENGSEIHADFSQVLQRGLDGILRYTETSPEGNKIYKKFSLTDLSPVSRTEYIKISQKIKSVSTGITISPIDVIIHKIQKAGYSVAEVTGRKFEVQINFSNNQGIVLSRKKINTNDAFRKFNNNEVDVLMINQSGSTGASAHAIVTDKVTAEKVKQRVMIVLQAELDISTEVQKRGRINRTGQIKKPIYDYVSSAIPAEKRLMMMLQKKLKSLDANTTSNQKQSSKILDVPDFLNKYGDKITAEYLRENPEINKLLDDPLKLEKSESDSSSDRLEDAAYKVSGRVAVLSTKMQQDFYEEISSRYNDYTEYLKQTGEYDLEVEAMDLQAETINQAIIKVGKGGESEFGDDSILETVRANVLRKPFSKQELENLIKESLGGKDPITGQSELILEYENFSTEKFKTEIKETNQKYDELIKDIPNEKKGLHILDKDGKEAFEQVIAERTKELEAAREAQHKLTEKNFENRNEYINSLLKFFYAGKKVNYPVQSYEGGQERVTGVFLGFIIDKKKKNPFAPSSIKLRFALASSGKYLAIPGSYTKDITAIIGASTALEQPSHEDLLSQWEVVTQENILDKKIRHIITGNLLQAFADFKGKLVSYTTSTGEVKKGILMPENWVPGEGIQGKTIVPIAKALKVIKSLIQGNSISTNNGITLIRQSDDYKIIVPASRKSGGDFFLDADILALVDHQNFERTGDKMVAVFSWKNIENIVKILQQKTGASVTLSEPQFELIKDDLSKRQPRKIARARPAPVLPVSKEKESDKKQIELEAQALEVELDLLNFEKYPQAAGIGKIKFYPVFSDQIYGLPKSLRRPPKVRILYSKRKEEKIKITTSLQAAEICKKIIGKEITVREHAVMLLLDRANQVVGYFKVAEGGISGTVMDVRLMMAAALNVLASSVIVCHNHPSGALVPSEPDIQITKRISEAGKVMDIPLLDHLIITQEGHFSFADEGQL